MVRVGEWEIRRIRANYLSLPDAVTEERLARHRAEHPEFNGYGPRLCDLPETDIWEGDVVTLESRVTTKLPTDHRGKPFSGGFSDNDEAFVVGWVSYHERFGDLTESLDHLPLFSLSDRLFQRSSGRYKGFELRLVERGNLWRRAHGELPSFRDLAEEAAFAVRVREIEERRHVGFTDRAAGRIAAAKLVEAGEGDGILYYSVFEGSGDGYTIVRFIDRSLGERVREATLTSAFEIPSADES